MRLPLTDRSHDRGRNGLNRNQHSQKEHCILVELVYKPKEAFTRHCGAKYAITIS